MRSHRLQDMTRGWFVGDFEPTALRTAGFEVAVQHFAAGEVEAEHVHRVAEEITVIAVGRALMCGREWSAGDIVVVEPGEATGFTALTDVVTVVVKHPSVIGDKYPVVPSVPEPAVRSIVAAARPAARPSVLPSALPSERIPARA